MIQFNNAGTAGIKYSTLHVTQSAIAAERQIGVSFMVLRDGEDSTSVVLNHQQLRTLAQAITKFLSDSPTSTMIIGTEI